MPSEKNLAEIKEMITAVLRQQNVSMASIRGSLVFTSTNIDARDAKAHTAPGLTRRGRAALP